MPSRLAKALSARLDRLRRRLPPTVRSNARRWQDPAALRSEWRGRTERIARLIAPGSSVIEFGAGRMDLAALLPEGCDYTPSDIVDRGRGTLVCDLNVAFPLLPQRYGAAVFSGVLEYVVDIPGLAQRLAASVDTVVASYATLEGEPSLAVRRRQGWLSHADATGFRAAFTAAGFRLVHAEAWRRQTLHIFVHARAPLAAIPIMEIDINPRQQTYSFGQKLIRI